MKTRLSLAVLALLGLGHSASAQMFMIPSSHGGGGIVPPPVTSAPVALLDTEVVGLDYPNNGTTTAVTGTSLTLTAKPGQWSGNVISRSYRWHTVSDPLTALGSGTTLAIDISATPALVGQVIEVDETASGLGGSSIRQSHWFGPIGSTAPVAPIAYETIGTSGPLSLPVSPANFLENGHAIFPGCDIPSVAPDTSNPAHVWYFDSVHGKTIDAGATGHAGSPFKDVTAFLGAPVGYQAPGSVVITSITNITGTTAQLNGTGFFSFAGQIVYVNGLPQAVFSAPAGRIIITLNPPGITPTLANTEIDFPVFPRLIQPGDTVYIEPGDSSHPIGAIIGSANFSTSDGTATGSTVWTWVTGDPAAASRPVLNRIVHSGGGIGFLYKGLNLEPPVAGTSDVAVTGSGTIAAPLRNMIFEDIRVSSRINHSDDPWFPSHYPTTGGQSDGTVVTATPIFGQGQGENVASFTATMAMGDTSASVPGLVPSGLNPLFGEYVFSANYYQAPAGPIPPGVSGIPNGTKIATINGLAAANFLYVGNTVATFAALPATWAITDAIFLITSNSHLAHWDGTSWTDLGTTILQFAPCDSTNPVDVASGCPTTNYPGLSGSGHDNVPGCDPLTIVRGTTYGGCPSGTPPAWNGATRAISAERLIFMPQMRVNPAGHYNNGDWGTAMSYAFSFVGGLDTADSQDPSNPNLFVGSDCISVKDSWAREVSNGFLGEQTTNSIFYNNRVKWTVGDAFDHYSTHRNWTIHNYFSDPQQNWVHVDGIQYAVSLGTPSQIQYGNAAIENELFQSTDTTAEFPAQMQAIGNTDGSAWGLYMAVNVVNATTNGMASIGRWNVMVHNINLGTGISTAPQPKAGASSAPIHSMMANNIANGVGRDPKFFNANYCDPVIGDLDEVWTNLSIPSPAGLGLNSSVACNLNHTSSNGAIPGLLDGVIAWTSATDWRSQQAGVSSLFSDYDPIGPPVAPAPGAGIWNTAEQLPCVNMSFFPFGCPLSGAGAMNERPNTGFAGTTNTILATVKDIRFLPQTGSIGDTYVASVAEGCFGAGQAISCGPNSTGATSCGFSNANQIVWPAGLYVRARTTTAAVCGDGDFTQWVFTGSLPNPVMPPYNPGIIGAGTNLGAQAPITDLDGKAWANPPSIGAYELH